MQNWTGLVSNAPKMITSYEELLESLANEKVDFVLVGGLAVSINGFVRTTDDIDILIDNSPANIERIARCFRDFGEGFGAQLSAVDFPDEPGAVRIQEDFNVDLFVRMNGKNLGDLSSWIGFYPLKSGVQIPYLKAEGLIETKRGSSREKDLSDIGALRDIIRAKLVPRSFSQPIDLDSLRRDPEDNA
jgi:hypothetical protein